MNIKIQIANKHATVIDTPVIVCGNSDYSVEFIFDEEWDAAATKTARFVYVRGGLVRYEDVVFTGNTVAVPVLANIKEVHVGVFAGNLNTTTPACIPCELSIRCGTGAPEDPTPSQYDQIMKLIRTGGATDEQVATAVDEYMAEHPGVTGLSNTSKALLLTILRNAVYTSNQKANIAAFETELYRKPTDDDTSGDDNTGGEDEGGGETEVTLTSISATYSGGDVEVGTELTDLSGIVVTATYSDGSTATVTDYTLTGTIAEGSNTITVVYEGKTASFFVTGVASVDAIVAIHDWDLTKSLTDTVGGVTADTTATQDENGLHFTTDDLYCDFGAIYGLDRTYELDIASHEFAGFPSGQSGIYGRLFMVDTDTNTATGGSGLIYCNYPSNNRFGWQFYSADAGAWNGAISSELTGTADNNYADSIFNGKTLSLYVDSSRHVTIYIDGVEVGKTAKAFKNYTDAHVYIGCTSGSYPVSDYIANLTVTGLRVYDGLKVLGGDVNA